MAITATTLSAAVAAGAAGADTTIQVASATGITAPNYTTGTGITLLLVDQEFMVVTAVLGTLVSVLRGQFGSPAQPHVVNSQVQIGAPGDFPIIGEYVGRSLTTLEIVGAQNLPAVFLAGSTDAIPSTVPGFYVVKTAGVNAMTLAAPTAAAEGNIIWVVSDTANAHTITATSLFANGTALKTTATFPAFRGASVCLRACNLVWHVLSCGPVATATGATGVVVFS
jgi:hypothetical protein